MIIINNNNRNNNNNNININLITIIIILNQLCLLLNQIDRNIDQMYIIMDSY